MNKTLVKEFLLVGFPQSLQIKILQFILFLIVYILTILGNSFLIFTIIVSPQLHTAMYYFLCNLSFLDLCYSSISIPKILINMISKSRKVSVTECLTQMNIGLFLGAIECLLLAVMAYDRYIAICFPLYYTTIMSWTLCRYITVMICFGSFMLCVIPSLLKPLVFCRGNKLNHYSCEILGLLELACGNISSYKLMIVILGLFVLFSPFVFIVVSYICIIVSILKIKSADGKSKTFSTCASHLSVVSMFYGTSMTTYMGKGKSFSLSLKYISLIYGAVTPLLNPIIYSLRNTEVKGAFWKILMKYNLFTNSPWARDKTVKM